MSIPMSAQAVLDGCFLEMRHKLIDLGAALDRIERGADGDGVRSEERMRQLVKAIDVLGDGGSERAARILTVFSDAYEEGWPRPEKGR